MKHSVKLLAKDCTQKDNIIYFVAQKMNLLYSLDMITNKIMLVDCIPEEAAIVDQMCGAITVYDNKLILAPNKNKKIWIYDLSQKKWKTIIRKDLECYGPGGMLQIIDWKDSIYIVGSSYPSIIKLKKDTEEITYIEGPYIEKKKIALINDAYFRSQHALKGNKAYFASCVDNYVLEFDLDTEEYKWIMVGGKECRYSGIVFDGNDFWLSPRTRSSVVKWDRKNKFVEIPLPTDYNLEINYFLGICYDGQKIILPCMIDTNSAYFDRCGKIKSVSKKFAFAKQIDSVDVMCQNYDGNFVIIHDGEIVYEKKLYFDMTELEKFFIKKGKKIFADSTTFMEGEIFSLDSFLDFVSMN